jgi:hypothetical protein
MKAMTTKTQIETVWNCIRQESAEVPIRKGEFQLIRLDPECRFDIFAGIDGSGYVMLAIGVTAHPPVIDVETPLDYFRQQRTGGGWLMVLRLTNSGLDQVFGRLCQDLVDAAVSVSTQTALITLFRERLILWKRLFQGENSLLLQNHQIKGLIAELLALEFFITGQRYSMTECVVAWNGPVGGDQDFLFCENAVEVKAISPYADRVGISSVGQLDAAVSMELWVYTLKESARSESGCVSLTDLARRIEHLLAGCPDALAVFRQRLLAAGYVEHEHYEFVVFTVMNIKQYEVTEGFPRICAATVSEGISDISYSILLSSITSFILEN